MPKALAARLTVHGFRSTFRDWCYEETSFSGELAEEALAHRNEDAVERAYKRADALKRRRELMQAWDNFVNAGTAEVIQLKRA
jgi:integrase